MYNINPSDLEKLKLAKKSNTMLEVTNTSDGLWWIYEPDCDPGGFCMQVPDEETGRKLLSGVQR